MQKLLSSEQRALECVTKMGLLKAKQRIDVLADLANARYREFLHSGAEFSGASPFNFLTEEEQSERHELLIGISLASCSAPHSVRERIIARRKRQRELAQKRQAA